MCYREAPGQRPLVFRSSEEILAHPCGEYVLDQLQRGVSPEVVLQVLLQEYLVRTDRFRLLAYRRFCEQHGDYWTLEHLELRYWEYLYELRLETADLCKQREMDRGSGRFHPTKLARMHSVFCAHANIAEELVPLRVFESFYTKHGPQAALPHQYPGSVLVKGSLAIEVVEAYSAPLRGRTLAGQASRCISQYGSAVGRQVFLLFYLTILF